MIEDPLDEFFSLDEDPDLRDELIAAGLLEEGPAVALDAVDPAEL